MLDISTNQTTNIGCNNSNGMASVGLLDDDMMDPLFDDDWLHEHNLDVLFDLFEEEIESKIVDTNNGSSSIIGTSPLTSYLFGTSPTLASALDYYPDLLFFENHQPTINYSTQQTTTSTNTTTQGTIPISTATSTTTTTTCNINASSTINSATINNNNNFNNNQSNNILNNNGHMQQVSRKNATTTTTVASPTTKTTTTTTTTTNHLANNPITNAMRIKRGLRKGQSEGVSLLARPLTTSSSAKSLTSAASNNIKSNISRCSGSVGNIVNKGNSDKTSTKITNFKKIIMGSNSNNRPISGALDIINSEKSQRHNITNINNKINNNNININRDRHIHHCHNHVHYITARAVIREHAYAMRGH